MQTVRPVVKPNVVRRWLDSQASHQNSEDEDRKVDWARVAPFAFLHLGCLLVLITGTSWFAVAVAVALYGIRMFAITAFYHRYFSHRAFSTSRAAQFAFAVLGNAAIQRGPLWWAAHHRKHHKHSDTARDRHSPRQHGVLWAPMGWFTTRSGFQTDLSQIRDFARYPELRLLDRFDTIVPILLALGLFVGGEVLAAYAPALNTNGLQLLAWGFFISTTILFHVTSLVNSAGHLIGRQRYATGDDSRNSFWLALLTLGEGWHNNHHHYPVAARQGFFWWEIDISYYVLRMMQHVGLIHGLKGIPSIVREQTAKSELP